MHPSTSYCSWTSSPGASLGAKENGVPQCRQKPSVRPGRPSRGWPTSCPQFPQNRRFSGTSGLARTADAGSRAGTGGTSTSPAPSPPREDLPLLDRVARLPRRLSVVVDQDPVPPDPEPPVAVVAATGAWPAAGASPQTLQYPSSIVPAHPGRLHAPAVAGAWPAAGALAAAGASPQTLQYPPSIVPTHPAVWVHASAATAAALPPRDRLLISGHRRRGHRQVARRRPQQVACLVIALRQVAILGRAQAGGL